MNDETKYKTLQISVCIFGSYRKVQDTSLFHIEFPLTKQGSRKKTTKQNKVAYKERYMNEIHL